MCVCVRVCQQSVVVATVAMELYRLIWVLVYELWQQQVERVCQCTHNRVCGVLCGGMVV